MNTYNNLIFTSRYHRNGSMNRKIKYFVQMNFSNHFSSIFSVFNADQIWQQKKQKNKKYRTKKKKERFSDAPWQLSFCDDFNNL